MNRRRRFLLGAAGLFLGACAPLGGRASRVATAEDAAAIHELYERHPVRVNRTAAETAALLDCPGMQALVLERDGTYLFLFNSDDRFEVVGFEARPGRPTVTYSWGAARAPALETCR